MKFQLYFFLFIVFNNCVSSKKPEEIEICNPSRLFTLEPAAYIFRDKANTLGLSDSFFLGTGSEFHYKQHGKWPLLNLISKEKWCIDKVQGRIQNNANKLFLLRVVESPSASTAVLLKIKEEDGLGWEFKKIKGHQYWILSKKMSKDKVPKALQVYYDEGSSVYRPSTGDFDEKNIYQVWNVKHGK